jgi:hypothetical protein
MNERVGRKKEEVVCKEVGKWIDVARYEKKTVIPSLTFEMGNKSNC